MRVGLSILTILFLIGCGGGGGSSSSESNTTSSSSSEGNATSDNNNSNSTENNTSSTNNENNTSTPTTDNSSISDRYFNVQWYLAKNDTFYTRYNINNDAHIHAENYLSQYTGNGVKVAVIDNGLDANHRDLQGGIKGTYNATTKTSDVSQNVGEYHGTEVTGVIGARGNDLDIYGVASKSDVYFIKYGDSKPGNADSDTIALFRKAVEYGADIINCSWGTSNVSDAVKEYIQELATTGRDGKGILIVFASGNGAFNINTLQYEGIDMGNDESAIPEVISVGASNAYNVRATYSNYGPYLDVIAPGGEQLDNQEQNIYSLYPNDRVAYTNGTSFSAPLVSGILAMMLEANPNLTRAQIENILKTSSDKIGGVTYDSNSHNNYYGYGKINVKKAIDEALSLK